MPFSRRCDWLIWWTPTNGIFAAKSNFDHIKAKHIDFMICDRALSPIIAIELDDSSHRLPARVPRDRDVNRILEIASLPILRVSTRRNYDGADIEKQLLAKLGGR
jgi:hypothetical protein